MKEPFDPRKLQWTNQVKRQDGYLCRDCGCSDRKILDAHHIQPVSQFPEKEFGTDNGRTLCMPCHAKKHKGIARILILLRLIQIEIKRL